jgi:1,4-dihydroxy-2-naphthoyl-CoA hydrolase
MRRTRALHVRTAGPSASVHSPDDGPARGGRLPTVACQVDTLAVPLSYAGRTVSDRTRENPVTSPAPLSLHGLDLGQPGARAEALRRLNAFRGEINGVLGVAFTDIAPGRLVATMPVEGARQPFGLLHGGASCVLAETLGSVAASLAAPPGWVAVGIDINATHHRAVRSGTVTGVCTPLHEGRTTTSHQVEIHDEAGRRLCTARLTCRLVPAAGDGDRP